MRTLVAPALLPPGTSPSPCSLSATRAAPAQDLMRKWAPGVGAGLFLERAISRKAAELTAAEVGAGGGLAGTIPALRTVDARA